LIDMKTTAIATRKNGWIVTVSLDGRVIDVSVAKLTAKFPRRARGAWDASGAIVVALAVVEAFNV